MSDRRREWSLKKREAGLCEACGQLPLADTSRHYCVVCLERQLDYAKKRKERLVRERCCIQCGTPLPSFYPTQLCPAHRRVHSRRQKKYDLAKGPARGRVEPEVGDTPPD